MPISLNFVCLYTQQLPKHSIQKPVNPTFKQYWMNTANPKTVAENWDSKAPSVGTILAYGLDHIFLGVKLFDFQDRKLKFSASVWKRISQKLIQLIQTIFISVFSIRCLIELKFGEVCCPNFQRRFGPILLPKVMQSGHKGTILAYLLSTVQTSKVIAT